LCENILKFEFYEIKEQVFSSVAVYSHTHTHTHTRAHAHKTDCNFQTPHVAFVLCKLRNSR